MSPRVTVLLAVHNGGAMLRDAVDSVLGQSYRDFELLVVDDASTDGAIDALPTDRRIRILRNERNVGQVPSLNQGLDEARGEYVARLDADDTMRPVRLARQIAVLDAEPEVALVGSWMDVVDEHDRLYTRLRGRIRSFSDFLVAILTDRYPFGHPSLMYRRDVVRGLGGYDVTLAPSEDKDLYRRLALARHDARCVEEPLVRYRRHEGQLSRGQADLQLARDHEGQVRFLAELTGSAPAEALRVLLADGVGDTAMVDDLLTTARSRLRLDDREVEHIARGIAHHLTRRAVRAGATGGPALRWAARREPLASALQPLLPLSPAFRWVGRRLRRATLAFPRLRRVARRSRWLRWIYARLG